MLNAIKAKLTSIAHKTFEILPPKAEAIESFKKNEFEFMAQKFSKAVDVHNTFGWAALATRIVMGKKVAQPVALAGFVISGLHAYDYFNVKYHANKQKSIETN